MGFTHLVRLFMCKMVGKKSLRKGEIRKSFNLFSSCLVASIT